MLRASREDGVAVPRPSGPSESGAPHGSSRRWRSAAVRADPFVSSPTVIRRDLEITQKKMFPPTNGRVAGEEQDLMSERFRVAGLN